MNIRDKQILHIALPSIISNITVPLLGLIDVAITGHLGAEKYLGAIAVGGMLFNIIYWLFAFLRMGTSGMTAQALGRRDFPEVMQLLVRSLGVAMLASIILIILQNPISEASLYFISPSEEVAHLSRAYFRICIYGAPASLGLFALTGWYIGMQNTRIPMVVAITQNVGNIIISLLLVIVLKMKIEGVALGTVIAQYIGLGTALIALKSYYLNRLNKYLPKRFLNCFSPSSHAIWNKEAIMRFFNVNKDIFFRTICLVIVHFLFIAAGAKEGDTELAVNTLLMQFFTLYSYIMDGFAFAGEAIAGKAIGAHNRNIYDDTVKRLFRWGVIMIVVFTTSYALFEDSLIGLLTNDANVIRVAKEYNMWTLLFPICGMAAFIWDGIYIGATATRQMLISMAFGVSIFLLLYTILLPLFGNHGLWIAFDTYLATRGIVQTFLRKRIIKW
ncbi:MAG: MATE family efflux transporter [Bacteroidaceae bacterium]|nr:MATE family efflux transporter [Bacteroidaceae bacterium]